MPSAPIPFKEIAGAAKSELDFPERPATAPSEKRRSAADAGCSSRKFLRLDSAFRPVMTKHLPRLDSLRGIAALMVAGYHAGLVGGGHPVAEHVAWFLRFFFDGRTGVCIFFVLSGLVLGISLRRAGTVTRATYFHFCGRRFFRLYPAYFVSTSFYLALYLGLRFFLVHQLPAGHGWCDYFQGTPLSLRALGENFYFLNQQLNAASWTLKVEVQAAFLFPFFHLFSLRFRGRSWIPLLAALIAISFAFSSSEGDFTRIYLYLFYLGYLLPNLLDALQALPPARQPCQGLILGTALTALILSHLFPARGAGTGMGILLAALGSTLLLLSLLRDSSHPIFSVLDHPLIKFLGIVSYSFYLFNLFAVDLTQRLFCLVTGRNPLETAVGWWIVFPVSTLFCFALSVGCFYLVERPGVRLGGHFLPSIGKSAQPQAA
jgi:peptidoglycan/LPS O-acetylase OafA/YrhL